MQAQESRQHGIPPMEVCHSMVTYVPLFMRFRIALGLRRSSSSLAQDHFSLACNPLADTLRLDLCMIDP
jgi:hypothetical protein